MDIAVGLPTNLRDPSRDLVLDWAVKAEQAGFSSVGMGERLSYNGWDWSVSLTAAAAVTTRVRLLSNIVILPIHPIGLLAKASLSLDALSNGRLSLGVGIGAPVYDYDIAPFARAGRWKRLDDGLVTLRSLWRNETQVDGIRPIGPSAVRPGGPELLLGALGPKSLRRAAKLADGVISWSFAPDPAEVRAMYDIVEAAWAEFDRPGTPRLLCGCYYAVGATAVDDLSAYVHDYYPPIFDAPVEPLIATMTCTSPSAIRDTVKRFEDIGCDEFVFQPVKASIGQLDDLADLVL
jgi:alkanesulfonate monooxygenase SsuD/methylene tetrahydromethanopterin reductase-like flavin-dependent oxidoreductase (luciferase family)